MAEPISEILAQRAAKSEEVQRLFQQFHQAYSELMTLDRVINPRLAILTDALYGISAPTPNIQPLMVEVVKDNTLKAETGYYGLTRNDATFSQGITPVYGSKRSGLEIIVMKILREEGKPLDTTELHKRVAATGFQVGGQNPRSNMGAHLSHSKIIRNGPRGWEIVRKDGTVVNNG